MKGLDDNRSSDSEISLLLSRIQQGDVEAREQLFRSINDQLRTLAAGLMRKERPDHTLDATALVDEACMKLIRQGVLDNSENRRYLFGAAVRSMRQILVDHARTRNSVRRGGGQELHPLDSVVDAFEKSHGTTFIELDEALNRLESDSPRQREVVELRFFSNLTIEQTASVLGCSHGTVETDWRAARAKLYRWLKND